MHGTTFAFIAGRAARYPVIMRRAQVRRVIGEAHLHEKTGDGAFRWLLLNTLATNGLIRATG